MELDSLGTTKKATIVYQKRRVLCSKNNTVFKKQYLPKVQDVVFQVNKIVQNAYIFLKLLMLQDIERLLKSNDIFNMSNEFSKLYPLDDNLFQTILTVVSSNFEKKKGRPHKDQDGNLEYPYEKEIKCKNEVTGQEIIKLQTVHCVLRCKNANCKSTWWNRDLLGVANQKRQALYNLENGCLDETFNSTTKPTKKRASGTNSLANPAVA